LVSTFYTLKQVKNRTYLYQITIGEDGKPVWKSKGIVSKLHLKDPEIKRGLKQAKIAVTSNKAKEIVERYHAGKLDKEKAKSELLTLLDRKERLNKEGTAFFNSLSNFLSNTF